MNEKTASQTYLAGDMLEFVAELLVECGNAQPHVLAHFLVSVTKYSRIREVIEKVYLFAVNGHRFVSREGEQFGEWRFATVNQTINFGKSGSLGRFP